MESNIVYQQEQVIPVAEEEYVVPEEVNWERLDKTKFFVLGTAMFSGVTGMLYPLSVLKTRQMVGGAGVEGGIQGAWKTAATIARTDGPLGFYRGFSTTILGLIPGRVVYLSTLEFVKSLISNQLESNQILDPTSAIAVGSFIGGATASMCSQMVVVPIDVISQRQMMLGSKGGEGGVAVRGGVHMNGFQMARKIIGKEGVGGLYRGFSMSIMTYIPSSAVWWSCYGGYQKLIWQRYDGEGQQDAQHKNGHTLSEVMIVQALSASLAGATAGVCTTPLDVVKTRLQVKERSPGSVTPTILGTIQELVSQSGPRGLFRGVIPRVANTMLWGTCMVSTYEFLKRLCAT
eukprot:TRINITY_DN7512_c0_g3_i2.p1 TRINITY_DN7512_c0_g3~~TRINITY_DN7512_c0_g3_i2.p1  ORF type:complete len:346 (-),score=46.48 TRINITY_DN7512_c0_g3_i2:187-1224(-)